MNVGKHRGPNHIHRYSLKKRAPKIPVPTLSTFWKTLIRLYVIICLILKKNLKTTINGQAGTIG